MSSLEEFKNDFLLLVESGFIAINQMDEDSTMKLFKAAEILDKNNSLPKIGYGYLALHKLELKSAIEKFEAVLKKEPNNEMAKAFLGIAISLTPKNAIKGEKLLEEVLKSDNKEIKKLAGIALDFVDRFVKKEPTPVEVKKKKGK
jgi:tetratricopeptide (TPR) repeat protein